jgi:hypothetical protein
LTVIDFEEARLELLRKRAGKPLEWERITVGPDSFACYSATTSEGRYLIYAPHASPNWEVVFRRVWGVDRIHLGCAATVKEAMRIAERMAAKQSTANGSSPRF